MGPPAGGTVSVAGDMERFGFVGLPNSGKSSLYNALAGGGALAAPYAFATTDPNVGVAKVPDKRLDLLSAMSNTRKIVPASVQFVDIGGLVEGANTGEGLGNRFLAHIREVDAVVYLLRAFVDADVPGPDDPLECLRVLEIELDLEGRSMGSVPAGLGRRQSPYWPEPHHCGRGRCAPAVAALPPHRSQVAGPTGASHHRRWLATTGPTPRPPLDPGRWTWTRARAPPWRTSDTCPVPDAREQGAQPWTSTTRVLSVEKKNLRICAASSPSVGRCLSCAPLMPPPPSPGAAARHRR